MNKIFLTVLIVFSLRLTSQNIWLAQNYQKGTFLISGGSGAFTRHLDQNYFNSSYNFYLKSPFLVLGTDYCFGVSSNAYWGAGIYVTSAIGKKEIAINSRRKTWINSLAGIHITHHSKWFVTKKIDLCSGYFVGFKYKNYNLINGDEDISYISNSFGFAAGVTATFKYYVNNNSSIYCQGGIGYRMNLFNFGCSYKIN